MFSIRHLTAYLWMLSCVSGAITADAARRPAANEIAETAKWFNRLDWPDIRGKPYVEVTCGKVSTNAGLEDGPKVRGFLIAEGQDEVAIVADGTQTQEQVWPRSGWPLFLEHLPVPRDVSGEKVIRRIPLDDAVTEVLTNLPHVENSESRTLRSLRARVSDRTAVFILARFCERQDRPDLAKRLDAAIPGMNFEQRQRDRRDQKWAKEEESFRLNIECELAHAAMWRTSAKFEDQAVSRAELSTQFARIARDFPECEHAMRAAQFARVLKLMAAEDAKHARIAQSLDHMSQKEAISELIFSLRDQTAYCWSSKGGCDILSSEIKGQDGLTPADKLVKLGYAAVPALIEALGDERPTRCVNYGIRYISSHPVLSVSDCVEQILCRIAGQDFREELSTSTNTSRDERTAAFRTAAKRWWETAQIERD